VTAVGVVPTDGRGSLPFLMYGDHPLVAVASWALERAGVELLDFIAPWTAVQARGAPLVIHDPLCPATPEAFLRSVVASCSGGGRVLVAVRPVTDTVKSSRDGVLGETVDRSTLVTVASPVVLPATVVAALPDWPDLRDLAALVDRLRRDFAVGFMDAPPSARRLGDASDLVVLEELARPLR
jgi:2-C-methyl-D-erythritol 4-phosphate cytidylyltransferase